MMRGGEGNFFLGEGVCWAFGCTVQDLLYAREGQLLPGRRCVLGVWMHSSGFALCQGRATSSWAKVCAGRLDAQFRICSMPGEAWLCVCVCKCVEVCEEVCLCADKRRREGVCSAGGLEGTVR